MNFLFHHFVSPYLKPLQSSDIHHVVGLIGHNSHDVEGLSNGLGFLRQTCSLRILQGGLQQHVVLCQSLNRLD